MAAEGAIADGPVQTDPVTTTRTDPDPKTRPDAGANPATSQPEYKWDEDTRTKGMLADLKKEREARQAHEKKVAEYEGTLKEELRRIAALAGITTPSKEEADTESVRAKIRELFPEMADIGDIKRLRAELEEQQVRGYAEHSGRMFDQICQKISAEYGELTESQKRRIGAVYFSENYNDPELHKRHIAGDPKLVEEFAKAFIDDIVEPIKRKVTASEAGRFRPVPGGRDRSTPIKGEKPKSGEDMLRSHFRAHAKG